MSRGINFIFILLTIIIIFFLYISKNDIFDETNMYGTWVGELHSSQIKMHINKDYTCELNVIDYKKEIEIKYNGICKFNFKKKPQTLSISKIDKVGSLYASFQFENENTLFVTKFANQEKLINILIIKENSFKLTKK